MFYPLREETIRLTMSFDSYWRDGEISEGYREFAHHPSPPQAWSLNNSRLNLHEKNNHNLLSMVVNN